MKPGNDEQPKSAHDEAPPDSDRERAGRRSAETLGLCLRCGAALRVGAALTHDCDERPS